MSFYIIDWAGNDKTGFYGKFKSFDKAIEAIVRYHEGVGYTDEQIDDALDDFEVLNESQYREFKKNKLA